MILVPEGTKKFRKVELNNGIVYFINGVKAKDYILARPKEFKRVNFFYMLDGIYMNNGMDRENKGQNKYRFDGTHIYIIGSRFVCMLEEY